MSGETVSLTTVMGTLVEVCHSTLPKTRGQTMITLESFERCDNYVLSLIRIIDIQDVGSRLSDDCRHLAAVLLKNVVSKRGSKIDAQPAPRAIQLSMRPLPVDEKATLKQFLLRYQYDPNCRVALQLSITTAKLARQDGDQWLQQWPELIPSLVAATQANSAAQQSVPSSSGPENSVNSHSFIRSMRGITTLNEVLVELSSRASASMPTSVFGKSYATLCAQLYPVISKIWGENMKKLQQHMAKLNTQAMSNNYATFGTSVTGVSQAELESLVVHVVLLSKVLRIVLEYGVEGICAAYPTFFKSFWKCYMGGVRILADFVRKHRPFSAALRQSSGFKVSACGCSGTAQSNLLVCMKAQVMADDDVDDMCDAYAPLELAGNNAGQADLLAFINLTLKLIKSLVCAPVIIQRKYPLLLAPCLGCMVEYYFTLLVEEYGAVAAHVNELSVLQLGVGVTVAGLSEEQLRALHSAQLARDALPLNYLVKATNMFLANVLTCGAYTECNVYTHPPPAAHHRTDSSNMGDGVCPMEESGALKAEAVSACDLRKTFFNTERVTQLMRMLLFPLLTFCDKELAIWAACPEDFVLSQDAANGTHSVKSAAEKLFMGLIEHAPDTVCAMLCPMLMDCSRQEALMRPLPAALPCPVGQYALGRELKIYDAVYMCAGLGVAHLAPYMSALKKRCQESGHVCPSQRDGANQDEPATTVREEGASYWVQNYLGPMVEQLLVSPSAGCLLPDKQQLLRARLVWLLSIWMQQFDAVVLPHVLKIITDIIGPAGDSDVVVKMNAVQALQALINLEIFDISHLKFHVVSAVEALCLLVCQLEESDCKIAVLEVAGELISLLSVQMTALKPLVAPLAGYLENLWSEAPVADPSRSAILDVMKVLVQAAKHYSASILSITQPLIAYACNVQSSNCHATMAISLPELSCTLGSVSRNTKACARNSDYLVRDGAGLWLAVMRNLTQAQFVQHHAELQQLFCAVMDGMGSWEYFMDPADPASAETLRNLFLVVEAYALLGGEAHSLLLDAGCQALLTRFYGHILGKVEARLVPYAMRPLQALLLSCPLLAGQYLQESGVLVQVLRPCFASVGCGHLCKIYEAHKQSDLALVAHVTLIAQLMLFNASVLFSALTAIKDEVLGYVRQTTGHADEKMLTESILLAEVVNLMFRLFDTLASGPAPVFTAKLWSLALLTLFPPTMVDNKSVVPPGVSTSKGHAQAEKPACIMGRAMLLIMNTLQFTIGRAKLEQYQWEHCRDRAASVDYYSLCFWFPSTLSTQQLYGWVEPLVRVCRGTLRQERSRRAGLRTRRELAVLISTTFDEAGCACDAESDDGDSDSECSDDGDGEDADAAQGTYDASMKASGSDQDGAALSAAITAQAGDAQPLDVAEEPIVGVHKLRMEQSGLLAASVEAHLTEKFSQLCRTLGEDLFSSLRCIADLGL